MNDLVCYSCCHWVPTRDRNDAASRNVNTSSLLGWGSMAVPSLQSDTGAVKQTVLPILHPIPSYCLCASLMPGIGPEQRDLV